MAPHESFRKGPPEGLRDTKGGEVQRWRENKWKLNEVNTRAVSREHNKLIGKFKIVVDIAISIRGQVMEYTYIPTRIERELVRFGMDCDRMG
jgi:hypothetical protein